MPAPGHKLGADNRAAVRALLASHLGITNREIAERVGLSPERVGRHVQAIRAEWLNTPPNTNAAKTPADQQEANLRARLDKIHSYASAIKNLAKGGAIDPSPSGGNARAFEAGAKAMREDCALGIEVAGDRFLAGEIRALPLPTPPAGEGAL